MPGTFGPDDPHGPGDQLAEAVSAVLVGDLTAAGAPLLENAAAVHRLVGNSDLLVSSTSFGGIHSSVDRRARWGDPVGEGFARISAGIEDTDDLVADIEQALPRR